MKKTKTSFLAKMDVGGYYLSLASAGLHGAVAAAAAVGAAAALVLSVPVAGILVGLAACNIVLSGALLVMANGYDRERQRENPLRPQPAFYELTAAAGSVARMPLRGLSRAFEGVFAKKAGESRPQPKPPGPAPAL